MRRQSKPGSLTPESPSEDEANTHLPEAKAKEETEAGRKGMQAMQKGDLQMRFSFFYFFKLFLEVAGPEQRTQHIPTADGGAAKVGRRADGRNASVASERRTEQLGDGQASQDGAKDGTA